MPAFRTFLIILLFICNLGIQAQYNITDFGAVSGQLCTEAIQKAIDQAAKDGGGIVIIPPGKFITGSLQLKSYVEVQLQSGSTLEGSLDLSHYSRSLKSNGIFYAEEATHVSITGRGIIDARGTAFYDFSRSHTYPEFDRNLVRQKEKYQTEGVFHEDGPVKRIKAPGMTVTFYHCSNVVLSGITIKDTPIWAVRFAYCENVGIDGITIDNHLMIPNSDGIHCTTSRNVRIHNCFIRAGDDAIIFTGFRLAEQIPGISDEEYRDKLFGNKAGYCENFIVTDCQLQSRSAGIRIGYGQQPIRKGIFSNIIISESNRGIGIFAHDASDIEDLQFSNIIIETRLHSGQWWGHGEPIHLSCISRFAGERAGTIRSVRFKEIQARGEHGILLYGDSLKPMEDILFDGLILQIKKGKETETYGGNFDLRPAADITRQIFQHDIPAIYAHQVKNLEIHHFDLDWDDNLPEFFTHAVEAEHVHELKISHFNGKSFGSLAREFPFSLKNSSLIYDGRKITGQ